MYNFCPVCKSKKISLIWNDKIRNGKNNWTNQKKKIFKCKNCDVGFLEKRHKILNNNKIFRKKFDGSNSVIKFLSFNKPREIEKIKKILKIYNISNKSVLESNCGAGVVLDYLKKNNKLTCGLDHKIYKQHVKKKHLFFSDLKQLKKSKIKFDVILSLSEIEHKYDPLKFIKILKKFLNKNGVLIFRIPNYDNIYKYFLDKIFLKYDFRSSHNFYFSQKSADYLFRKLNLNVIAKNGINEYSINHFLKFLKKGKRVAHPFENIINKNNNLNIKKNIEKNFISTSMIYIVG
jgi:2-polyprenyl-3-methyl-5-hydroxy-6-metoxy-1,4-benzoquinol methylase